MNSKYISLKLLTLFLSEYNCLDRLSYYIAIKKVHKSGDVLKIRELSSLIGCSYNSTNFHLILFQKLGLLTISKGKLFFVSTRKLTWEKGTKHLLKLNKVVKRKLYLEFKETQVKELKKEIRAFILINSLVKQGHVQKNGQSPTPLHAGISAKSLGKKINRSVSTGQRLITRLQKDKIIKITPKFEFVGNMTKEEFNFARTNFLIPQWSKFNDGIVIRQMYSEMEIIEKEFIVKKIKSAVAFFLFFLHGTSIGNGHQGISYNVLRIYEVRLNEISNYKQMLVGVSCIHAVRRSTYYGF